MGIFSIKIYIPFHKGYKANTYYFKGGFAVTVWL